MTSGQAVPGAGDAPRFSIVTAVHNVHRYLPEFIESIETQTFDLSRVEIIAVDDGSSDDSLVLLKEWAARRPELVTVLTKENGGQSSARNLGLEHVRGEWVTFPDPDDMLRPGYLAAVDKFLLAHPAAMTAATDRLLFMEATGQTVNEHPMKAMYAAGNRLIDLELFPDYSHNSAAAGFFRTDLIQREQLRFDPRIRPVFEDGHFCISYLLACEKPLVGFVKWAPYIYRKRADNSSTLQTSVEHPDRYLAVPKYGYLDVLRRGAAGREHPPEWLQNMVLYDISYYFSVDLAMSRPTGARGEVADQFVEYLREIATYLQPSVVNSYGVKRFDRLWRDILLHSLPGETWVSRYAVVQTRDELTNLVRVAYRYCGPRPDETILSAGLPFAVQYGKVRSHDFFGRTLMHERVAWVPANKTLRIVVNGTPLSLQAGWQPKSLTTAAAGQLTNWFGPKPAPPAPEEQPAEVKRLHRLARSAPVKRAFDGAWVLMDRIHDAGDNAEHLFKYLRAHRRDINAWFVVERDTPAWDRLAAEGYGSRLVEHGSLRWKLLMLNCAHLVCSHVDAVVHRPQEIMALTPPTWKFSFLQHGVLQNDLSRWLNAKNVDLFVTTTPAEQASVAGDDSPYSYTSKEVKMTGIARYDRLRELGSRVAASERDLVLICPTWRNWLSAPVPSGSQRRGVADGFFDSQYWHSWSGLLQDDRLRDLAAQRNLRLGFLPHPNIQSALPDMSLPPHVEALTWLGQDVQRLLARAAVVITDYSSLVTDAAYIDRPVVYFQFDREQFEEGSHVGRPGYFRFARDGFGPVTGTVEQTVSEIDTIVTSGERKPAPEYQRRIDATFTQRDGRCCERTTAAIEALLPKRTRYTMTGPLRRRLAASPRVKRFWASRVVRRIAKAASLRRPAK